MGYQGDVPVLPDLGVHKKPKPKRLQDPENEALGPIQKSQPQEVAIGKQSEWPYKERQLVIFLTQKPLSLGRVASKIGLKPARHGGRIQFGNLVICPSIMAGRPFGERHPDIVDHCAGQLSGRSTHEHEMLIVLSIFAAAKPGAEEPQMPGGAHAPMAKNTSEKTKIPRYKIAGMDWLVGEISDGADQMFIHDFVRIEVQLPMTRNRQMVDRPVALRAIVFEGMLDDDCSE